MPVFNGEQFLRQAVDSMLEQEYTHWELVVADDGSTDSTRQILESYSDARIRYNYKENGGQASALNFGLELAEGEYISTLDADDWLPPDSLSARVRCLEAHPEFDAVYSNGIYTAEDGRPLARFSDYCISGVTGDLYERLMPSNMFGTGAAVLVRAEVIRRRALRYDEGIVWCQDWDFYLRLAETATFAYLDSPAVFYRLHSANMTMQMPSEKQRRAIIRTRQKVLASGRFERASIQEKCSFFYNLLREDLRGDSAAQRAVIEQPAFQDLPASEKARLVRLVALDYLQMQADESTCGEWLRLARSLDPGDRKTNVVAFLFSFSPGLARRVVGLYRKNSESGLSKNPLQLITGS
jgi:glycosyltransferase involved in cell wall biosynthesis